MSRVFVSAYVPAAYVSVAEAAVGPYLSGPGAVWTVPLAATAAGPATHYGLCGPVDSEGPLFAALAALRTAFTTGGVRVAAIDGWSREIDWLGWLASNGLTEVRTAGGL